MEDPALGFKDRPYYLMRKSVIGLVEGPGPDRTPGFILLEFGREKVRSTDKFDPYQSKDKLVVRADRVMTLIQMTDEEVVEAMAESAHEAWIQGCQRYGITSRKAAWGEEFMVPWEDLSEDGKQFDRIIMRGILKRFTRENLQVVPV